LARTNVSPVIRTGRHPPSLAVSPDEHTHYSDVDCLRVVLDNLNTHNPAAFYDYLPPEEARRLLDTLEFHFTPSTAAGSAWQKLRSTDSKANVSTDESPKKRRYGRKYTPGSMTETQTSPTSTGDSHPVTHGTNSNNYTLHFRVDIALDTESAAETASPLASLAAGFLASLRARSAYPRMSVISVRRLWRRTR
jgi:hypothetical protein